MQEHEQRVVTERDELQTKIVKLEDFMTGQIFEEMEYTDRKFMRIQLMSMMTYCEARQLSHRRKCQNRDA